MPTEPTGPGSPPNNLLLCLKESSVIAMPLPFGRDNHHDPDLVREGTDPKQSVNAAKSLKPQLGSTF